MAKEDSTWQLYYWPKLAGRAEFVRIIFEEVGEKFTEINDLDVLVPMFRQGKVSVDKICFLDSSLPLRMHAQEKGKGRLEVKLVKRKRQGRVGAQTFKYGTNSPCACLLVIYKGT